MSQDILSKLRACQSRSVPIVVVNTPDQASFIERCSPVLNGEAKCLQWDFARGLMPANEAGADALSGLSQADSVSNPAGTMAMIADLPPWSVVFVHNTQRFMEDVGFIQATCNLRSQFARNHRMLVLLGPRVNVPVELANDVLTFDEELPPVEQTAEIIARVATDSGVEIDATALRRASDALRGLSAFQVEQLTALHLKRDGLDYDGLWEAKRNVIRETPGLSILSEPMTFGELGGLEAVKTHVRRVLHGGIHPTAVVWLDEVEKALAGQNDLTGITKDQVGVLLTYLQDKRQRGFIFLGHPGTGKSAIAKAAGAEAGIPTIRFDLGGMMGSLVGQSQQAIRRAVQVVDSISGGSALWIATCNSIAELPAELQQRFTLGTYFFDLPTAQERQGIWSIHQAAYELSGDASVSEIDDAGWVGRDIQNCCDTAWACGMTLAEASRQITPLCTTGRKEIEARQGMADGKYLDASKPGLYRKGTVRESAMRSVQL